MILLNITRSRMGRLSLCLVWTVVACPFAGADVIPDNVTIQTGDTPTLFFRKTGDTTDFWSLSANEASLTLTSTSVSVPVPALRIDHGAPSNSMRLMEAYLGFGTANPQTAIHVVKSAETGAENVARFQVADASVARLDINNATTTAGIFVPRIQGKSDQLFSALTVEALVGDDTGSEPAIVYNSAISTGSQLFNRQLVAFRNNGVAKASIAANGDMTATSFNPSSSRRLKDQIVELDRQQAAAALQQLVPVQYVYRDDSASEPRVGFIAEDVPDLVADRDRQSVPIMDVVALVTRIARDQHQTMALQAQSILQQQEIVDQRQQQIDRQDRDIADQKLSLARNRKLADQQLNQIEILSRQLRLLEEKNPESSGAGTH